MRFITKNPTDFTASCIIGFIFEDDNSKSKMPDFCKKHNIELGE